MSKQLEFQFEYPIGSWVRAYTTSARYEGAPTELGQVVGYGTATDYYTGRPSSKTLIIRNKLVTVHVPVGDVIGSVDIEKLCSDLGIKEIPNFVGA